MSPRVRPLAGRFVRLSLAEALPLRIGDRALLRDPGSRAVWGVSVLAPDAPPLRRRGAAAERGRLLGGLDGTMDTEVAVRGLVRAEHLARLGVTGAPGPGVVAANGWLVSRDRARELRERIEAAVMSRASELQPGVPVTAVAEVVGLEVQLVSALVAPPLRLGGGRLFVGSDAQLPETVARAWDRVRGQLERNPYDAPDAAELTALGLDRKALAALARAGLALRLDEQVVLLPDADVTAARLLARLHQPFTLSEARQALGTTRRVAVPLLEHLDRRRLTVRHPDSRRTVRR